MGILKIEIGKDVGDDYKELFSEKHFREIKQSKNTLYLKSYEQLNKLISPKRMDLLLFLMGYQEKEKPLSVSQIADSLKRHQEAVSRDLVYLKGLELVRIRQERQMSYAFPVYSEIDIKIN